MRHGTSQDIELKYVSSIEYMSQHILDVLTSIFNTSYNLYDVMTLWHLITK
jgi:hypothetical protein